MPNTNFCPNCEAPLRDGAEFCSNCGQRSTDGKRPVINILQDFVSDQLDLDGRLWRSLRALPSPGRLTIEYFLGHRKSHLNPFKLFFIVALVSFAMLKVAQQDSFRVNGMDWSDFVWFTNKQEAFKLMDSLAFVLPEKFSDTEQVGLPDSILNIIKAELSLVKDSVDLNANLRLGFERDSSFMVSVRDFNTMATHDLVEAYAADDTFIQKMVMRQKIKTIKDPSAYLDFIVNNLAWMLACFIPIIAIVLKLLFIRRKRFYVEHLVFSLHLHTVFLILISLFVIVAVRTDPVLIIGGILLFSIYLYYSMRNFYQQSTWKTLAKYLILHLVYPFLFAFFAVIALLVSILFL